MGALLGCVVLMVGLQSEKAGRRKILSIHTAKMPLADDVDLDGFAARTERFTGADLEDLVRRAGMFALRGSLDAKEVTGSDFEMAMEETFWAPAFGSCTDRWGTLWMVGAPGEFRMPG